MSEAFISQKLLHRSTTSPKQPKMPQSASKIVKSSDSLLYAKTYFINIPLLTSLLNQNNISLFCHLEETTMKTKTIDIFKTRFQKDHTSMSQNNVNNPNIIRKKVVYLP